MKLITNTAICSLALIGLSISQSASAQNNKRNTQQAETTPSYLVDTFISPIPTQRALFTTRVYNAIDVLDKRDGKKDQIVKFRDENSTATVTEAIINQGSKLVVLVENLNIDHGTKIKYHKIVENAIKKLNTITWSELNPKYFSDYISTLREMIIADHLGTLPTYAKENASIEVLDLIEAFDNPEAIGYIYEKIAKKHPEKLISKLPSVINQPYADHVITAAAQIMPGTILSYAKSKNQLNGLVRRNQDPLVKTIVQIADKAKNMQKLLPFVGAINRGEKDIKSLDILAENDDLYLQALVDLIVADEPMGRAGIENEINIRTMKYVREINALHDASDPVRFKCLQNFRDIDLYVIMIGGQDEIYTSSFTRGPFITMMKKMDKKSGTVLLEQLNYYHFRTFVRMTAGFSRLSNFLGTMNEDEKTALLKKFVSNLEEGDEDELEDAVDVADAYGSIKDEKLITFLKDEVTANYERVKNKNSQKGIIIYGLLATIFNGSNNTEIGDLPIPPITHIPVDQVKNDKGEIIEQMFFYGDSDGKTAYSAFMYSARLEKRFKVDESNKYWAKITSVNSDNKLTIYANKPLTEPEDEVAQRALKSYMLENDINPTVIVHRGHSYFVPTTIEYISPDVKMIILGSCGGYHNLSAILNTAEDAHIISSKQTGTTVVNEIILRRFHSELLSKSDINWVTLWNDLDKDFAKISASDREYFADYVPPNKNLGAIFIKAYKRIQESI